MLDQLRWQLKNNKNVEINGVKLSNSDEVVTIVRAGIIDGDAMIKTPWGDARLAKMAIEK